VRPIYAFKLKEVGKPGPEHLTGYCHCALNCLHLKGYTHHESQLTTRKDTYTFSRRKHVTTMSSGRVTDIFIPNDNETVFQERENQVKQFAIDYVREDGGINGIPFGHLIDAPAEFNEDESRRSNPLDAAVFREPGPWLEDNGFVTREIAYEDIFRERFKESLAGGDDVNVSIFSRMIVNEGGDASW